MQWYIAAAAVITLVISVFAVQNSQQVALRFLLWELPPLPLVLIILFSAATGVLVTLLFSVAKQIRLNMQVRDLQTKIRHLEKAAPAPVEKSPPGGTLKP